MPRVKHTTPTPPTLDRRLWTAALELATSSPLAREHSALQGAPPLDPLQIIAPARFRSSRLSSPPPSLTAPFLRHIPTMANLRGTLLIATLLSLALLATPHDVVAGPIPGAAAYFKCQRDWRPCIFHNQGCAQCVISCRDALRKSPKTVAARRAVALCSEMPS